MDQELYDLATRVGATLEAEGLTLVTAESCTGGWVAKAVTDVPGSSGWFERGYVTYTNQAKCDELDVGADTLARFGAVSEEVVREMAEGGLRHGQGDVSVAVSGVAGPTGGTADKPVGLVCLACARPGWTHTWVAQFTGDREAVRRSATIAALEGVLTAVGAPS